MKKILTSVSLLLILGGCAKNQIVEGGSLENSQVGFEASSNKLSRAGDKNPVDNTAGLQAIGSFKVSGYISGTPTHFENLDRALVSWDANSSTWEYTNAPYWPTNTMDFLAFSNWGSNEGAVVVTNTAITATDVVIAEDALSGTGQKDMMVAMTVNQSKRARTPLSFKHALTQILFRTGNLDPAGLNVRIGGLRIVNIKNQGTMVATAATSDINWTSNKAADQKYHLQSLANTSAAGFVTPTAASSQTAFFVQPVTPATTYNQYPLLKTGATDNNQLLLMPQTFNAWVPGSPASASSNAYIELLAVIKHSTNNYYYCGTQGANLGDDDVYGKVYIPISSLQNASDQWLPGRRITYIITFGDSNSGSGGGGFDEKGDPILVKINFSAKVENWVDIDSPLLTATFNVTSNAINATFVDEITNRLLTELATAKEEKIYRANINVSGTLSIPPVVDLTFIPTTNKIAIGSTITYNFAGVNVWNTNSISVKVPNGWVAQKYKGDVAVGNVIPAAGIVTLNGIESNKVEFKKM